MSASHPPPLGPRKAPPVASRSSEQPSFRFATLQRPEGATVNAAVEGVHKNSAAPLQQIDKRSYFHDASSTPLDSLSLEKNTSWAPTALRPVPAFYPLEKSSRLIEDTTPVALAIRLVECLRQLSVHAVYDNAAATASLLTQEHVEMHLSLWNTPVTAHTPGVLVELQRRKGDSMAFHRYSRVILDAAVGDWDDNYQQHAVGSQVDSVVYSKKVQRLLTLNNKSGQDEHENALVAIEIAHGLLLKDRMDARQLGLESLCLLTDPRKTGYVTAVLTSHVVLLGSLQGIEIPGVDLEAVLVDDSPLEEIRQAILSLVQFSRIGEDDEADDGQEQTMTDTEHLTLLHNLALAVLANALQVIETSPETYYEEDDEEPEDAKPRARLRTASSSDVTNEFLKATEETSKHEVLSTLIRELSQAGSKPHDACLSAKCLGTICKASDEARKRAKELGAKTVVATALDVGQQTHLKLETECEKVQKVLTLTNMDD